MGSWIVSLIKIIAVIIIIGGYLQYRREKKEAEQSKVVYSNRNEGKVVNINSKRIENKSSDKLKLLDKER